VSRRALLLLLEEVLPGLMPGAREEMSNAVGRNCGARRIGKFDRGLEWAAPVRL